MDDWNDKAQCRVNNMLYKTIQTTRTDRGRTLRSRVEFITECSLPAGSGRNHIPKEGLRRTVAASLAFDLAVLLAAGLQITDVFTEPDGSIRQSKHRKGCSIE